MTLAEAKEELRVQMGGLAAQGRGEWKIRVITGKGRHSGPGGGVLVREIYDFFSKTYRDNVIRIDSDPSKSLIEGVPIRGHFDVTVKY